MKAALAQLVLVACLAAMLGLPSAAQDVPTIRVSGCPCDDFIKTVYYAVESGLFRKYGLNVEAVLVSSGAAAMAGIVGGDTQVAYTSTVPFLQAYLHGVDLQIVSPGAQYLTESPNVGLLVKSDSTIHTARDLNGKTIAVQSLKDLNWAATLTWIDKNGGDSHSIKVIELPLSAVAPAIDEGRIAAGTLQMPFLQQAIASGKLRMLAKSYDAVGRNFVMAIYVARKEYIAAHRDTMAKFSEAMHDSIVYTNDHPGDTVRLVASYTHVDPLVIAHSVRVTDPEYLTPQLLKPVVDIAYRYRLIDRDIPVEDLLGGVLPRR